MFLNTEVYVQYEGKLTVLTHNAQHVLCAHGSDYASHKMVNKRGRAHAGNSARCQVADFRPRNTKLVLFRGLEKIFSFKVVFLLSQNQHN